MNRKGFAPIIILIFAGILIAGGLIWYVNRISQPAQSVQIPPNTTNHQISNAPTNYSVSSSQEAISASSSSAANPQSYFYIKDNNVYFRGNVLVKNIPASLSLMASTEGQITDDDMAYGGRFSKEFSATTTADYYSFVSISDF